MMILEHNNNCLFVSMMHHGRQTNPLHQTSIKGAVRKDNLEAIICPVLQLIFTNNLNSHCKLVKEK